jgi:spermidine synthase
MRRYLYFTVFFSGLTSLAAEFTAERLLARVFGTSNLVWSAIIGLILIYLAVGYFIGGRWADRSPRPQTLFGILAAGSFALGVVPFISNPILIGAAQAFDTLQLGVVGGAFAAVLILFSIPVTLLAMASPFAIRLSTDDTSHSGSAAGTVYTVSTIGSVIGSFLPTVVLIPLIGTTKTILLFSGSLLLIAIVGLILTSRKRILFTLLILPLILIGLLLTADPALKKTAGQIYETESAYNYIEVVADGDYRYLRLNDGQGIHSEYHPTELFYGGPWELFLVGPMFNAAPFDLKSVERIAIVGLAAGTTARQATAVYGNIPIDGFEIDPKIVEVGQKYFEMTMPNLNIFVQDGRYGLAHSPYRYDIIAVDAYRPPYIPWHMTTQEFFQIAADHLTDNGVLVINIGRAPGDRRLIDDLAATIKTILPSVYVMDVPNTFNSMLYATRQPTSAQNLTDNFFAALPDPSVHLLLKQGMQVVLVNLQPTPETGMVFTDDLAPIEWITNNMILSFILEGGVDTLK